MSPRRVAWIVLAACLALPSLARADAVEACPPGFDPSHSGCRFDPGDEDLGVVACCCAVIGTAALGAGAVAAATRRARRSTTREP